MIAENQERSRTQLVFQSEQKKVHENFSIQSKNDHQKLNFEAKTPERALKATFTSW